MEVFTFQWSLHAIAADHYFDGGDKNRGLLL